MQEFPGWVVIGIGLASYFLIAAAAMVVALGVYGLKILGSILQTVLTTQDMVDKELRRELLPIVTSTMKNVERMSDDAADTTHNVTSAANRVANLVGSAANRIESPLIKAVGIGSGLLAAGRAIKGDKKPTVIVEKKRGFRGK